MDINVLLSKLSTSWRDDYRLRQCLNSLSSREIRAMVALGAAFLMNAGYFQSVSYREKELYKELVELCVSNDDDLDEDRIWAGAMGFKLASLRADTNTYKAFSLMLVALCLATIEYDDASEYFADAVKIASKQTSSSLFNKDNLVGLVGVVFTTVGLSM